MEDEEILQLISDQRAGGKNDMQIGRVLRMRGVSDVDGYLKKKTILRPRTPVRKRQVRGHRKLQLLRGHKSLVLRLHL